MARMTGRRRPRRSDSEGRRTVPIIAPNQRRTPISPPTVSPIQIRIGGSQETEPVSAPYVTPTARKPFEDLSGYPRYLHYYPHRKEGRVGQKIDKTDRFAPEQARHGHDDRRQQDPPPHPQSVR